MLFTRSPWRFTGSTGGSLTVGIGDFLSGGGTNLNLYVTNTAAGGRSSIHGGGITVSVGLSAGPSVELEFATADMPGNGIDHIYYGPGSPENFTVEHFAGPIAAWTLSANLMGPWGLLGNQTGHGVTMVAFISPMIYAQLAVDAVLGGVNGAGVWRAILANCKALGLLHGGSHSPSAGVNYSVACLPYCQVSR
jgi:hypothetical protein